MRFMDHPLVFIVMAILSFPIYRALAKLFFGKDLNGLGESLKYVAQADWYSLLKGRFWQDWDATLKFNLFAFLCIAWPVALAEMVVRTLY